MYCLLITLFFLEWCVHCIVFLALFVVILFIHSLNPLFIVLFIRFIVCSLYHHLVYLYRLLSYSLFIVMFVIVLFIVYLDHHRFFLQALLLKISSYGSQHCNGLMRHSYEAARTTSTQLDPCVTSTSGTYLSCLVCQSLMADPSRSR